jgi:NAD(P) transhydrogenase
MNQSEFDFVVIGSGPAGQKAAVAAAKLGKKVAIIDRNAMLGGVSVHTGTLPAKTLREAILHLTGFTQRTFYGQDYSVKQDISVQDLGFRVKGLVQHETDLIRSQLKRNGIAIFDGLGQFVDPHTIAVKNDQGTTNIKGDYILICCGTRPAHNPSIPFDGKRIIDTDQLANADILPKKAIVVGAGVIGLEYSSFLAALGVEVILIEQRSTILDFVDHEIVEALMYHLREIGTTFRLGEKVSSVGVDAQRNEVFAELESGKRVHGDCLLYAVGRQANTDLLNLSAAGLKADERGRLKVNDCCQTEVEHIYAAGDVIGFPALASTSMEQGRIAANHLCKHPHCEPPQHFPYGIYTIPEISTIGQSEEELTAAKVPYEVGVARYSEVAKAMMMGDETGMLKILFDRNSLKVLGVHAIGERATELIHVGQAVMAFGGKIDYFRDAIFNYPTFAEAFKIAAFNGLNKI